MLSPIKSQLPTDLLPQDWKEDLESGLKKGILKGPAQILLNIHVIASKWFKNAKVHELNIVSNFMIVVYYTVGRNLASAKYNI